MTSHNAIEKEKKSNSMSIGNCSVSVMLRKDSENGLLSVQLLRPTYFKAGGAYL